MKKLLLFLLLSPALALAQTHVVIDSGSLSVSSVTPGTAASSLGKAEDAAHTSADVGVLGLAVRNTNVTGFTDTTGDYSPISVNTNSVLFVDLHASGRQSLTQSPLKLEDEAFGAGEALMLGGSVREDSLSVDTGGVVDVQPLKSDKFGRLLVNPSVDAHLFVCNSAADIVDTSSTAVCAADADEIYNIQSITCTNTDATVATRVDILDGATVVWQCHVSGIDKSGTTCSQTFPSPLKMAAINTAINAQAATTSAQVRCSIAGFKTPS